MGLLKEQLGFNGMVITDASHMLGMRSAMRREDYVQAVATIMAKLDGISLRFENILLRGVKHHE